MPDLMVQSLAIPGLPWLAIVVFAAGLVYGFVGFGAALIYMPFATRLLPMEVAVAAFSVSALSSLFTVLPRAWPQVERRGVALMVVCATFSASAGIWVLRTADIDLLRWGVVGITGITLAALIGGWRYRTVPRARTRAAVGLATGFVGGSTGLMGPVMVLFQLAGSDSVATSRATALVFLTITSLLLLPLLAIQGLLTGSALWLGLIMLVPYGLGTRVGQALFQPEREALYCTAAYVLIGVSIVFGLPIWD
ncbi:sulfite exporter TauE/SafE family protein [Puniceibacterium sp. IMCC21224]|uniref:sulfite exporter TauE/SafE family protein n=1 Tax=Puniceibacterium sp. IMCC21224 TaxID=1618204 RepID=UPI00064DDE00|nr:sulfite exporter TauE/SafE family protein [Puniceibacterium sp. IMCC21224]